MRKDSPEKLSGNEQFEGYAIDLIHEISRVLGFNYTLRLAPDGRYGSYNKESGDWDGMVRELLEQRADLAIADLTITYDREQVQKGLLGRKKTKIINWSSSGGRLYDAIYEPGNISALSETCETTTESVFVPVSALA